MSKNKSQQPDEPLSAKPASHRPSILHCPIDETFESCDIAELDPIVEHLRSGSFVDTETAFARGTHLPDGRLDLCKQSIGPLGAERVAEAILHNPKTQHWLLGANGLRDEGAATVADTIRDNPHIETVYLGCNLIGPKGATKLAEALTANDTVTGLWLKRNPIGSDGAKALADMLSQNQTLRTLDLTHTQISMAGLQSILNVLSAPTATLRRIYLGGNGFGVDEAQQIADMLRQNRSLHSLYLNVGKLSDAGTALIADALLENKTLRSLNLASNDIGRDGAWKIAESLQQSTTLQSLHLGFDKSTRVLGERPNRIGDGGCVAIAELISVNRSLQHLDLARNGISAMGAKLLLQPLQQNDQLTSIVLGRGVSRIVNQQLQDVMERNREVRGVFEQPDWQDIEAIRSVYR